MRGGEREVGGEVGEKSEEGHGEDCGGGLVVGEEVVTGGGEGLLGFSLGTSIDAGSEEGKTNGIVIVRRV